MGRGVGPVVAPAKLFGADAVVTLAYKLTLFALTGRVNNSAFKGFAAGECLFLGAPGTLTITGTYTQNAGTLRIELGGLSPGTEHDQLAVSGVVTLGGTLRLKLIDGFVPRSGDAFTIITCSGTASSSFSSVVLEGFPGNLTALVTKVPGAVIVTVMEQ